jgi:phenylacetic acid degradation operon negative regulatory protein
VACAESARAETSEPASVLLAPAASARGLRILAERAWDLSGLAERYAAFEAEFGAYVGATERLADRQAFLVRTRLIQLFRVFPFLDPELPDDLVSLAAERERAVATFDALWTSLAAAAMRHFDGAVSGYVSRGGPSAAGSSPGS